MERDSHVLATGSVLDGRYEILERLATGGMGEVYRARRVLLGDEVAIKVILTKGAGGDALRERFLRESRACAQLRHPHIVSILDYDVDADGRPFLVMEYLNGSSLREELAEGAFALPRVQTLITQLAAALQLAHDRGIVHRDLKPANVVCHRYESGEVVYKLIDFGIANMRETEVTRLTDRHQFVGTVSYASPEQLRGESVDARSDVYSLGALVFELLSGAPPFEHAEPLALAVRHLTEAVPSVTARVAGLPAWVDDVMARAMAKEAAARWPTVTAFARALSGSDHVATTAETRLLPDSSDWLGKYELQELLGSGRFGSEVYAGVHRALGHRVAIRTLRRGTQSNWEVARGRFLQEARALQLVHPSVMQVRDYGEDDDLVYVVTERVEGPSLRQILVDHGFLPWPRLARLSGQLLAAAAAIHHRGGLLCGLTPEIIRVTQDEEGERLIVSSGGVCHVQDLMAMLSEATLRGAGRPEPELYYVAPELLLGQSPDTRADVFTLATIIYEMATGRRPFEAATLPTLLGAMLRTVPADPRVAQPDLPEAAAHTLLAALSADPQARPATAAVLAKALV